MAQAGAELAASVGQALSTSAEAATETDYATEKLGRKAYIVISFIITVMALFDCATDWANAATFFIDYRKESNRSALASKAQHWCGPGPIPEPTINRTVPTKEEIEQTAEFLTFTLSMSLFVFSALGLLVMIYRLWVRWDSTPGITDSNNRDTGSVSTATNGSSQRGLLDGKLARLVKPSPFMDDRRVVFSEVLTLLLKDAPLTWINIHIIVNTCQKSQGLRYILLGTSLGAMFSSFTIVWTFALHFAHSIKFFRKHFRCYQHFHDAIKTKGEGKDSWRYKEKVFIYPWIVLFVSVFLTLVFSFALSLSYFIVLFVILECGCEMCKDRKEGEEPDFICLGFLIDGIKYVFVEKPGETLRLLVMYVAVITYICNLWIVLHYFKIAAIENRPERGFLPD